MAPDDYREAGPVTVARFEWQMQANLARGRLASCGIEARILEEFMGSVCWHWAKGLGGIRLQVRAADAEDARAILEEAPQEVGEPVLAGIEEKADRVLRAAVFGAVSAPVGLYAFWLLLNIFVSTERLGRRERRKVIKAAILNVLLVVGPPAVLGAFQGLRRFF